jgi:hypothetical protein
VVSSFTDPFHTHFQLYLSTNRVPDRTEAVETMLNHTLGHKQDVALLTLIKVKDPDHITPQGRRVAFVTFARHGTDPGSFAAYAFAKSGKTVFECIRHARGTQFVGGEVTGPHVVLAKCPIADRAFGAFSACHEGWAFS